MTTSEDEALWVDPADLDPDFGPGHGCWVPIAPPAPRKRLHKMTRLELVLWRAETDQTRTTLQTREAYGSFAAEIAARLQVTAPGHAEIVAAEADLRAARCLDYNRIPTELVVVVAFRLRYPRIPPRRLIRVAWAGRTNAVCRTLFFKFLAAQRRGLLLAGRKVYGGL